MFRLRFTGLVATVLGVVLLFMPMVYEEKDADLFTMIGINLHVIGLNCLGIAYAIGRFRA